MSTNILSTIVNAIDTKENLKKRIENGKLVLQELLSCVNKCQLRFAAKAELATEDDIRIVNLCDKWEKALAHGIKTNLNNSAIQSFVTAGYSFTFNITSNTGNTLWDYTCLHLTKHEKERYKILNNVNTSFGYFRAFLRAALNERSLERYLQSWISHGLLTEYYEEGSIVRQKEAAKTLCSLAAGLSNILFALSIDKQQLNESQHLVQSNKPEHIIPLPVPVKLTENIKNKPMRQVISFDKSDSNDELDSNIPSNLNYEKLHISSSAPATSATTLDLTKPEVSHETSAESKTGKGNFFPDMIKMDSPSQILNKLSERAKEMFTSTSSISKEDITLDDSDTEEVSSSINEGTSYLELCLPEEDHMSHYDKTAHSILENLDNEISSLRLKCNQIEQSKNEKIAKLEKVIIDLSRENNNLKEQLKQYMSAVEMAKAFGDGNNQDEEAVEYQKKLIQVAEMHAELMEFNQHLQKRLQELENKPPKEESELTNIQIFIPSAFLVGRRRNSYHVYQIFIKVGQDEWNIYHRYAKFYELHMQLKKCHPDIAKLDFPPKKTIGKRDSRVVEARRAALQQYLRRATGAVPALGEVASRDQLVAALPFFGTSSIPKDSSFIGGTSISNTSAFNGFL